VFWGAVHVELLAVFLLGLFFYTAVPAHERRRRRRRMMLMLMPAYW
jgi:hypothetical protein